MNQEEEIEFYKDGYTDMCGRFSYAVLSGSTVKNIKKFALLISSEDYGNLAIFLPIGWCTCGKLGFPELLEGRMRETN